MEFDDQKKVIGDYIAYWLNKEKFIRIFDFTVEEVSITDKNHPDFKFAQATPSRKFAIVK